MNLKVFILLAFLGNACLFVSGSRSSGGTVSLGTFNVALFSSYGEVQERTNLLIQLIEESNLDVICLQEVWMADVQRQVYRELQHLYPYFVSLLDLGSNQTKGSESPTACSQDDVQEYVQCIAQKCTDSTDIACYIRECLDTLVLLTYECKLCLLTSLGTDLFTCAAQPASNYEMSFGIMLLSRKEITESRTEGYLGSLTEIRGFYQASIRNVGEVFCTHLSTSLDGGMDYVGPPVVSPFLFKSYAQQQYRELVRLLEVSSVKDTSILIGDFNHGPSVATPTDVSNITYDMPFNYGYVNSRGYYSPYVILDGRCTYCFENLEVFLPSRIIDHLYLATTASGRVISAERIWDNVQTSTGWPISDHYGVKVVLREIGPCPYDWEFSGDYREGKSYFMTFDDPPDQELEDICQAIL